MRILNLIDAARKFGIRTIGMVSLAGADQNGARAGWARLASC
jgi:hypothetical protein